MTVINAENLILGRMASIIAKRLLSGEEIIVVNAEKAIISGSIDDRFKRYKQWVDRGSREKGPFYPKRPDHIVRRTVRGMLPFGKTTGREAYRHLKVFIGVPVGLKNEKTSSIEQAEISRLGTIKYVTVGELSQKLGASYTVV